MPKISPFRCPNCQTQTFIVEDDMTKIMCVGCYLTFAICPKYGEPEPEVIEPAVVEPVVIEPVIVEPVVIEPIPVVEDTQVYEAEPDKGWKQDDQ